MQARIKKTIFKGILILSAAIFLLDQTIFIAHANDEAFGLLALNQIEETIDQGIEKSKNSLELNQEQLLTDWKTSDAATEASLSKRQKRIAKHKLNIEKRWTARIPKIKTLLVNFMEDKIRNTSEAQLDKEIHSAKKLTAGDIHASRLNEIMNEKNLHEKQNFMIRSANVTITKLTEKLPHEIAEAGGTLPFLIHAKSEIKELKTLLAAKMNGAGTNRMPASLTAAEGVLYALGAVLVIIGIALFINSLPGIVAFLFTQENVNVAGIVLAAAAGAFVLYLALADVG